MKKLLPVFLIVFSVGAFAAGTCGKGTTKENVAEADAACNAAKAGEVCILANNPPSCGKPGPAGAACKRDKVCASGKCDLVASKCL